MRGEKTRKIMEKTEDDLHTSYPYDLERRVPAQGDTRDRSIEGEYQSFRTQEDDRKRPDEANIEEIMASIQALVTSVAELQL